jgi:hypothetical protein
MFQASEYHCFLVNFWIFSSNSVFIIGFYVTEVIFAWIFYKLILPFSIVTESGGKE